MSSKVLVAFGIALAILLPSTFASAELSGGGGNPGDTVVSWVIANGPGGGVAPPHPGDVCGAWSQGTGRPGSDPGGSRVDAAGVSWNLFYRDCNGVVQFAWVPAVSPAQLGAIAFDSMTAKLPKPSPLLSPDVSIGGYVNFESWLAVTDPGVVSATSQIPGLSATASARVVRVEWRPGDGSVVKCEPFGALPPTPSYTGKAPCGHTYKLPSAAKVTGFADDRFHGSVTLVWKAGWTSSNGASGDLGETSSVVPFVYRVREIQTIGAGG